MAGKAQISDFKPGTLVEVYLLESDRHENGVVRLVHAGATPGDPGHLVVRLESGIERRVNDVRLLRRRK